jgi:hypothetical protein
MRPNAQAGVRVVYAGLHLPSQRAQISRSTHAPAHTTRTRAHAIIRTFSRAWSDQASLLAGRLPREVHLHVERLALADLPNTPAGLEQVALSHFPSDYPSSLSLTYSFCPFLPPLCPFHPRVLTHSLAFSLPPPPSLPLPLPPPGSPPLFPKKEKRVESYLSLALSIYLSLSLRRSLFGI